MSDDIALSRLLRSQVTQFTLAAAGNTKVFNPNMQRVGYNVAMVNLSIATTVWADVLVGSVPVFHLAQAINFVNVGIGQFGDLPTLGFTISLGFGTTVQFGVIEWFAPEEYIAACLCEYKQRYAQWLKGQ